ncbi:hypothetical protein ETB97_000807, partial [Aspergillus alliaceus]
QELRNSTSLQSVACQWLEADWNLLLSGTPWYNSIADFRGYMPFLFRNPDDWNSELLQENKIKDEDLFTISPGHSLEFMLCNKMLLERYVFASGIYPEEAGQRLRRVLSLLMIRRTITSTVPFKDGTMIGSNIPGSQKKAVQVKFDQYELITYMSAEKDCKKGLFIRDRVDNRKFHWNSRKLRKLTLLSSWLGFVFLAQSLHAEQVPAALR